jgi:outer membrane scaffolding protein for murein synthesis (MipA/OmpV family)
MRIANPLFIRPSGWRPPVTAWALAMLALGSSVAQAQADDGPEDERPTPRAWDAAVGWVVSHGPPYPGSAQRETRLTPGLALRWGRVSLASRSAFSVRGAEAGTGGGLRVELADGERLRVGLGLRADSGRQESDSDELRGLGDVRRTVRLRLSVSYRLDDGWRLRSLAAADALGRGGGLQGDLQVLRDLPLSPSLVLNGTVSLGWGNRQYLQAYYGVTPEQAVRSGYPVSTPSAGLRDLSFSLGLRQELGPRWALFGGAGVSRLIGRAADSPLTREPGSWSLSLGMVYRL